MRTSGSERGGEQVGADTRPKILHVEAGPTYGGSLRALELYLANALPGKFQHDVLLYYETPGHERLYSLVANHQILCKRRQPGEQVALPLKRASRMRTLLKSLLPGALLDTAGSWINLVRSLPRCLPIFRELRARGYDLVHVNNSFTYQPATLIAAKMAGLPVVAHVRNPQLRCFPNKVLMRMADRIVTVSRYHEEQLKAWGMAVPVITCYDCVEPPVAEPSRAQGLRTCLLRGGKLLIGAVGRLDEQKGYEDFIRAARIVVQTRPEARFVVAGDGPLRATLGQLIKELQLDSHFELCGFRRDVPDFLAALDLFVCSSHWEGLPLAVVEAMLLKKPVIATNVCGNPEVVRPGRTGTLVPAADPKAMAAAMISTLEYVESTRLQTHQAYELAMEQFDPTLTARHFDEVLSSALSSQTEPKKRFLISTASK